MKAFVETDSETRKAQRVVQIVDSLDLGGMESVAVNLANLLSARGVRSYVCSTRAGGPLVQRLSSDVTYLSVNRRGPLDVAALRNLVAFLRQHQIEIIHAHGSAVLFTSLASMLFREPKLLWHDHFGRYKTEERPAWIYRLAMKRAGGVIAVNEPLAIWARARVKVRSDRVWYVPNFVLEPEETPSPALLPRMSGNRLVCVANLRPEKDHLTLLDAMREVVNVEPTTSLFLVGGSTDENHTSKIERRIQTNGLTGHVFLLGRRSDVWPILLSCNIGVLSSVSEGMPLALLEYGLAGLATVATRVGQVPEVLDEGRAGLLVPPGSPLELARAILSLVQSHKLSREMANCLRLRVKTRFSGAAAVDQITKIYGTLLS